MSPSEKPIEGIKPEVAAAKAAAQLLICQNCGEARSVHINIKYGVLRDGEGMLPEINDVLVCRSSTYFEKP